MADKKISQLNPSSTPLAGTEVLPIVQSGTTVKATVENVATAIQPSGTANAVVYLNGTKQPTSSSGLKFDGTNLGVGVATPYSKLDVDTTMRISRVATGATNSNMWIGAYAGSSSTAYGGNVRVYHQFGTGGASSMAFEVNGTTETFRLDTSGDVKVVTGNIIPSTAAKGINFTANTPAAGMTSQLLNWYEEGTWTPVIAGDGTAGTYQLDAATKCSYTRIGRVVHLQANIKTAGSITGGGAGNLTISGLPYSKPSGTWPVGAAQVSYIDYTVGGSLSTGWGTSSQSNILYIQFSIGNGGVGYIDIAGLGASETIRFNMTYEVA